MAKTIHVRGEGGAVIKMDLPLPESIQERFDRGLIRRVNADGSPYSAAPAPEPTGPPLDPDPNDPREPARGGVLPGKTMSEVGEQTPETVVPEQPPAADSAGRPPLAAPKADWIAYVVKRGQLSAEDAATYTKADLIDLVS
ncbi:hypothetical protein ACFUJU_28765 [Streptomyces sp. NPDC057235]|uniref:hypothetical protein n=1 Tax=Streptomyces sp. NPDC057235 TaxID=3346058 RepID=UPI00363BC989